MREDELEEGTARAIFRIGHTCLDCLHNPLHVLVVRHKCRVEMSAAKELEMLVCGAYTRVEEFVLDGWAEPVLDVDHEGRGCHYVLYRDQGRDFVSAEPFLESYRLLKPLQRCDLGPVR